MIGNLRRNHQRRFELPMLSAPVQFEPREVAMDPYAMGLLLGDGCITLATTPSFSTNDPELVEARAELDQAKRAAMYRDMAIMVRDEGVEGLQLGERVGIPWLDRKSTRLNSSH